MISDAFLVALLCVNMYICQGVKGSSVSPVERVISLSPSCRPAVIEVSYIDSDGHTTSIKP